MNHWKARQRETDQRWDYTCREGQGRVYATGYCGGYREFDPSFFPDAERLNAEMEPFREKYHTDGHATEAEAIECYRQYQLDRQLKFNRWTHEALPGTLHICDHNGCTEYTPHQASIGGYHVWHLCPEHLNRETVDALYTVGESFGS